MVKLVVRIFAIQDHHVHGYGVVLVGRSTIDETNASRACEMRVAAARHHRTLKRSSTDCHRRPDARSVCSAPCKNCLCADTGRMCSSKGSTPSAATCTRSMQSPTRCFRLGAPPSTGTNFSLQHPQAAPPPLTVASPVSVGFEQSPYELEVGFVDLSMGIAGVIAASFSPDFWWAVILISSISRVCCGIGHIRSMVRDRNFAVNNTAILVINFVVPAFLIVAYLLWAR